MSINEDRFIRLDEAHLAVGLAARAAKISRLNKYAEADKVGVLEINWELGLSSDTFGNERKCKAVLANGSD